MNLNRSSRLKVLVVDDDADAAESLALLVGISGHDAHIVKPCGSEQLRQILATAMARTA